MTVPPTLLNMDRIDVEVEGATLAAWAGGSGPATLVALHAGVADSRVWYACAPRWIDAGWRVVAYDRRGHGTTRHTTTVHDPRADLDAVLAAVAAPPRVAVLGNSMGGQLALDWALANPDRVASLVLVGSLASGTPLEAYAETEAEQELDARIAAAEDAGDVEEVNRLEVRYWLDGTEQPEGRVGGEPRALMTDMNGIALRSAPAGDSTAPRDAWVRLGDIAAPTLVLAGAHDLPGQNHLIRQMAARIPAARMETMAGTAHLPSLDIPELFATIVLDHIGRDPG